MTINETDWRGHVVWYVQYFWREVEWAAHDAKIDEVHDKDCIEQDLQFQFFRNCAKLVKAVE